MNSEDLQLAAAVFLGTLPLLIVAVLNLIALRSVRKELSNQSTWRRKEIE
jgi:hypothetical protein